MRMKRVHMSQLPVVSLQTGGELSRRREEEEDDDRRITAM